MTREKRRKKPNTGTGERHKTATAPNLGSVEPPRAAVPGSPASLLYLQRTVGNHNVVHWLAKQPPLQRKTEQATYADSDTGSNEQKANNGQPGGNAASPYPGKLLRFGSTGAHVRAAQTLLNRHGFGLATDGIFGPMTHQAVQRFQQVRGLQVDGIIGPLSWEALTEPGETTVAEPPDYGDYASELQQTYARLLDEKTSAQEVSDIIATLLGKVPGGPENAAPDAVSYAHQPWSGQSVTGLELLLQQVNAFLNHFAGGFTIQGQVFPLLGIRELNLLLRVAQEGSLHPGLVQNFPKEYLPLAEILKNNPALRQQLIPVLIFLTMAEGYRRLILGMIALKKEQPQNTGSLAKRMAFVHRAMSFIGTVESRAASGETARATIDKKGYTTNSVNQTKKKTDGEYPLRKGHDIFDQMWIEAVDEKYYSGNDRWGSVGQYGDHIRLLRPPDLPSWCGIFVNWIALQEGLASSKWESGGGNVDYKKWPGTYAAAHIHLKGLRPGDVLYAMSNNQHECIAISYDPATEMITSIDGNTAPGGGTTGGQILVQERPRSFFSHVRPFPG